MRRLLVAQLAREQGINPEILCDRLVRLDAKLGGKLLSRPGCGRQARYFVDLDVLEQYAPTVASRPAPFSTAPPDGVMTLGQLARLRGFNTEVLRNQLIKLNEKLGGRLLVQFSSSKLARYYVNMPVLREFAPALAPTALDPNLVAVLHRIEQVEHRVEDLVAIVSERL